MNVAIVFAILAVALFGVAYVSKRRFGLLGLALATGSLLSGLWGYDAGLVMSGIGIFPKGSITTAATLAIIVVLPAILLLFHGYSYKNIVGRIIGSTLFMLLALAFLVQPLGQAFSLEGVGVNFYQLLANNRDTIISLGLVIAVVDLFLTKPARMHENKKGKH